MRAHASQVLTPPLLIGPTSGTLPQPPTSAMSPANDPRLRRRTTPEKASTPEPAPSSTPQPTSGSTSRVLLGVLSIAFSAYVVYDKFTASTDHTHAPLPDAYALCSREGAQPQIYTVDPENPRAHCLLVHGDKFLSAGSLGASRRSSFSGAISTRSFRQITSSRAGTRRPPGGSRCGISSRARWSFRG